MKVAGEIFLAVTFVLLGYSLSQRMVRRSAELKALSLMISDIKAKLSFSCPNIFDLITQMADEPYSKRLFFFPDCKRILMSGEDFPKAFQKSFKSSINKTALKKEDLEILTSFMHSLGTTALKEQIEVCDTYKKLIEENLKSAKEKEKKYSSLLCPLGALLGIAAAIAVM